MPGVIEIQPSEIKTWVEDGRAILIDVREDNEVAQARIADAIHLPLSRFDPHGLPDSDGKHVAFVCAHCVRSQQVSQYLVANGLLDEAYNVTGGLAAWAQSGLAYE